MMTAESKKVDSNMGEGKKASFRVLARDYVRLARIDKPIGIYLVLWPTLWALWFAAEGLPSLDTLAIFVAGVVLMRSAGCVINDFADRKIDGLVKRTEQRPLVTGHVSAKNSKACFVPYLSSWCYLLIN